VFAFYNFNGRKKIIAAILDVVWLFAHKAINA
jgi:hypothetical protein